MSADTADAPAKANAQAEQDTENMLAALKSEAQAQKSDSNETADSNPETDGKKSEDVSGDISEGNKQDTGRSHEGRDSRGRGGFRGRGGRGGYGGSRKFGGRDNIKSDLTTQEVSDDPVAIRKQVEFYFSDSNLPMDKFLLSKVGGSQNNAVELSTLHSFKRMRHFQPFEAIVEALKESTVLELTDDDTAVRRKEPLPEALSDGMDPNAVKVYEDKAMPRSVYVKGFGEEEPSTQFDIEAFFAPYGPTNAIRLRRTDDKLFKRSVFVEFETEELAKKFLELDPKPKFQDRDLMIMSKKEYCDKKVEDIKSGKIRPNQRHSQSGNKFGSRNGRDFKRKRDNEDDRDWRERREEDRKNGFRDDRRRGHRDHDSRGKGDEAETDDRGVPVVKATSQADGKNKRDDHKAEALAKARAAVEHENAKDSEAVADDASKKRLREEEDTGDAERENKKQDVKTDA